MATDQQPDFYVKADIQSSIRRSENHFIQSGGVKATFNVVFGKGCLLKINDFEQSSAYPDDICFFFGSQGIYLNRHVVLAFNDAKAHLLPLVEC